MKTKYVVWLFAVFCFLPSVAIIAQDNTCPQIVSQAIQTTDALCGDVGRNRVCYGNVRIDTQFQEGAGNFIFESGGDLLDIAVIERMTLSAMQSPDAWGMALMSVQANIPDTLPGQNVTLLLFGDVAIENEGETQPPSIELNLEQNFNVRGGPGSNFGVISGVVRGTTIAIIGRNEFGDWLQVRVPELQGTGWIYAAPGSLNVDTSTLEVVDPNTSTGTGSVFAPMSAFVVSSGVTGPQCTEAPQDGMLIQSPSGVGEITLRANDVLIEMGSTIFMQAVPGDTMNVYLLEGAASVTYAGFTVVIPPGARAEIPLDNTGRANGSPRLLTYNAAILQSLPLQLLPEAIEVAAPVSRIVPFAPDATSEPAATDAPDATSAPNATREVVPTSIPTREPAPTSAATEDYGDD